MDKNYDNMTSAILVGGNSSRMGKNKAGLTFGGSTFLELMLRELETLGPCIVSASSNEDGSLIGITSDEHKDRAGIISEGHNNKIGVTSCDIQSDALASSDEKGSMGRMPGLSHRDVTVVSDIFKGCGPSGGIHAALKACRTQWMFAVSCDMPLFRKELAAYMYELCDDSCDIAAAVTRDGHIQPLCAFYNRSVLPILEENLRMGKNSVLATFDKVRVREIDLTGTAYPDEMLRNINTMEQYKLLLEEYEHVQSAVK